MAQSVRNRGRVRRWLVLSLVLMLAAACTLPGGGDGGDAGAQTVIDGPPVVVIQSPQANATYLEGISINILATISNAGPDIARVVVELDGARIGDEANPNPTGAAVFNIRLPWTAQGIGSHTINVSAERADGTASAPVPVTINIVQQDSDTGSQGGSTGSTPGSQPVVPTVQPTQDTSQQQPTQGTGATNQQAQPTVPVPQNTQPPPPSPTDPPPPTAQPTSSQPRARMNVGVNIRQGPGTVFAIIGSMAANDETTLLAVNPAGTWYKIQYYNGEGWVFGTLVTTSGNLSNLPVDAGPPTPVPTNTPLPPSATPIPVNVNLAIVNVATSPHPLTCAVTSEVQVTIRNTGTQATPNGGAVSIQAILNSTGAVLETTRTVFPVIAPGQQVTVSAFITVSVNTNETQHLVVRIDVDNQVTESDENDNTRNDADYVLQRGSCP